MVTHNNYCIQQSDTEARQDVAPVMLVIRHSSHDCVPRHHDEQELYAVAEELGAVPREAFVEVHLEIGKISCNAENKQAIVPRVEEYWYVNVWVLYMYAWK